MPVVSGGTFESIVDIQSDVLSLGYVSVAGYASESISTVKSDSLSTSPLSVGGGAVTETLYGIKSDLLCSAVLNVQGAAPPPAPPSCYIITGVEGYIYSTVNLIMLLFVLYLAKRAREEAEKVGGGV